MLPALLLSLREGLEGSLVIGVLLGTIKKLDRPEFKPAVWAGTITAIVTSLIAGIALNLLGASLEGEAEAIFEGATMVLASILLTTVIFWIYKQSTTVSEQIKENVRQAALVGSKKTIFGVSFLSVFREGIELALILVAASFTDPAPMILLGAGLGLVIAVALAYLLFNSLIRLNLKRFFQFTSILLVLFAAGLLAHGVHELNEVGFIPEIIEHVWDMNAILSEQTYFGQILTTLFGYNANPSLTEVIAYLTYFGVIFLGFNLTTKKGKRMKMAEA